MFGGIAAVGIGAALGAWLRWSLSTWLNPRVPAFPLGTFAANLVGGYLVGLAVAFFMARHDLPHEARLFVVTGFLGGLTTFSTYSAEVVDALLRGQHAWSFVIAVTHLVGSLLATVAGIAVMRALLAH